MKNEHHFRPEVNIFYCISQNVSRGASLLNSVFVYFFGIFLFFSFIRSVSACDTE